MIRMIAAIWTTVITAAFMAEMPALLVARGGNPLPQTFLSRPLTPERFTGALTEAGLVLERELSPGGAWAV